MFHDIDFDELEVMFDEVKKICYNVFFYLILKKNIGRKYNINKYKIRNIGRKAFYNVLNKRNKFWIEYKYFDLFGIYI